MLVTVVADYGTGDLAFAEVRQRIVQLLPEADVTAVPVPAFDTVSAGFCAAQLAFGAGPPHRIVYVNVAPRQDHDAPRANNAGERLAAARLRNGVLVVGVAAGASLSFLAAEGVTIHAVDVPDHGSQFRSRDVFPEALAALADSGTLPRPKTVFPRGNRPGPAVVFPFGALPGTTPASLLGEELPVPPPPQQAVAYVDGYGNIKTTWDEAPAPPGTTVQVRIGDVTADAAVSDGVFEVPAGTMSFAPGSSGWPRGDGAGRRTWWELLTRGSNTAEIFGNPRAGTPVVITR